MEIVSNGLFDIKWASIHVMVWRRLKCLTTYRIPRTHWINTGLCLPGTYPGTAMFWKLTNLRKKPRWWIVTQVWMAAKSQMIPQIKITSIHVYTVTHWWYLYVIVVYTYHTVYARITMSNIINITFILMCLCCDCVTLQIHLPQLVHVNRKTFYLSRNINLLN